MQSSWYIYIWTSASSLAFDQAAIFYRISSGSLLRDSRFFYCYTFASFLRNMSSKLARKDSVVACDVCCEDIEYFAIGACDHPVCHKCCIRMRVLGKETYCPVCRSDLPEVRWVQMNVYSECSSDTLPYFVNRNVVCLTKIHYWYGLIKTKVKFVCSSILICGLVSFIC